jgi:tRNA(Ile2)-agmatinylcytidine synthase
VVFAPHSQDPVLFGIRGDDPGALELALSTVKSEPYERTVLYMTNQGTDAHIKRDEISRVVDNRSYRLRGNVLQKPEAIVGGHLFFTLGSLYGTGSVKCAAFEPTKNFRDVIRRLLPGDLIEVYGAVREGCLNLEKIEVIKPAERAVFMAPQCPNCRRRMKSAGRNQGYRCKRCGTKAQERERKVVDRDLERGFYEVPPSARRHLAKPLVRMRDEMVHPCR